MLGGKNSLNKVREPEGIQPVVRSHGEPGLELGSAESHRPMRVIALSSPAEARVWP